MERFPRTDEGSRVGIQATFVKAQISLEYEKVILFKTNG